MVGALWPRAGVGQGCLRGGWQQGVRPHTHLATYRAGANPAIRPVSLFHVKNIFH